MSTEQQQQQKRPAPEVDVEDAGSDSKKAKTVTAADPSFLEQVKESMSDVPEPPAAQQQQQQNSSVATDEDDVCGIEFCPKLAESEEFEKKLAEYSSEVGKSHLSVRDLSETMKSAYRDFILSVCNMVCDGKPNLNGLVFEGLTEFGRNNGLKTTCDAGCLVFASKFRAPNASYDIYRCLSNFSNVKNLRITRRNTADIKNPQAELYVVYGKVNLTKDKNKPGTEKVVLYATNFWGIVNQ